MVIAVRTLGPLGSFLSISDISLRHTLGGMVKKKNNRVKEKQKPKNRKRMKLLASNKQYFIHNLPLLWKSEREHRGLTLRSEDSGLFMEWEGLNIGPKILQNSGIRWGSSV